MKLSLLLSEQITLLSKEVIVLLQNHIASLGFTPVIHFELEGCYQKKDSSFKQPINFSLINLNLKKLRIDGEVIPEYWQKQWEYVSLFNGQLPLKEADNLAAAIYYLPKLFAQQDIEQTLIKPVVWTGDKGKLAKGCDNVFSGETRAVHIPNAIQMNVSVNDSQDENIIINQFFGEYLQQCFIETSLGCSLLYLPEEEAFERFSLRTKYGLAAELCSPTDISGGHQGSVALYKEKGKHNQAMGEKPLLYDHNNQVLLSESHWRDTARIEHRLGASSIYYNAYLNVIFGLLNIIDALDVLKNTQCQSQLKTSGDIIHLPESLASSKEKIGAIELFEKEQWFAKSINRIVALVNKNECERTLKTEDKLGDELKKMILRAYQPQAVIIK
jgi:hypothetical protein